MLGLARLTWYVRRRRIDIVQSADRPRDALVCVLVGRLTKARSIVHVHVAYGEWMSPLLKWALRHADALVGVSSFVAESLVASGHDVDRVHAVPNGIDVDAWTPGRGRRETRSALGIGDDVPVILTICRLFREKGPSALIEALEVVGQHHPDVRLLIAGHEMVPGYADELRRLARDLDLEANVALLGRRRDVEGLLAACDVFAMPSLAEPFGLVFVEAMAMEVPVVALDSGGATEIVVHEESGLLSDPGDRAGLAKHLLELVDDPVRRAAMGKAGRTRAESCFTSERMAADMAAVYEALVPVASSAG
jgi:phosphatidylinositol alpha-1,6-mannosyltransferase